MKRMILCVAVLAMTGCAELFPHTPGISHRVRGPMPDENPERGADVWENPDSTGWSNRVPFYAYTTLRPTRTHRRRQGWEFVSVNIEGNAWTGGTMAIGWIPSDELAAPSENPDTVAARLYRRHESARLAYEKLVDRFAAEHPELTDAMKTSLISRLIVVGMPAEAAEVAYGRPDGVEEMMDREGTTTRFTYRVGERQERTVVTIRDGVIVGMRRGVGAAEDAYR